MKVKTILPTRIQRRRTKGWRMPADTVYVGRGSFFGNPFIIGGLFAHPLSGMTQMVRVRDAAHAMVLYDTWLDCTSAGRAVAAKIMEDLPGRNVACWCAEDSFCHGDVILRRANPSTPQHD